MSMSRRAGHWDRRELLNAGVGMVAVLAAPPLLAQSRPTPIGTIEEIRGEVSAERAGDRRNLAPKGEIFEGDVLSTGANARLVMRLGKATTIRLGAEARLKVDRWLAEAGGELEMQAGHLMFERYGKPASQGITFRSAYGLMAVRGTRFYAGPNRGTFALLVDHGRVEMTAGGRSVMVRPGEGIDIKSPGDQPTTPARWREARVREMLRIFR